MSLNCKLDRNITLSQGGEGVDSCNGQDISVGVGGISSPVLVYNISDVPSLTFEGDNRSDHTLYVETINSIGQFFKVDHTDATYNEEYDPSTHKWTHTLTLTVANIQPIFEDILGDAVNGKYLVCFRPNGAEDYRMFGWKYGATLDYSLNIQSDSLGYTITFADESEYPLFAVDKDNFGSKNKTYSPIFKPLYDVFYCEQDGSGRHTGYIVAMYVVKVNAAGQPLDSDNKLCQWSGKKQDAYKISGIQSDGGYNIIGTYQKNATFDGKPVKIYDLEKCPANVTNSIFINSKKAETINLNSTISGGTFTITSSDEWSMVSDPQYVTISPVEGENGSTQCSVHHNGVGGCEQIKFMNNVTREIVTLDVCVNLITVGNNYTYECNTTDITIVPTVEGCSSAYTYSVSPSISNSKDAYGYIHLYPTAGVGGIYTITLTHSCDANEVKTIKVNIICHSKTPTWSLIGQYCEYNSETSAYTQYWINVLYDSNPYSDTFGDTKTERVWAPTYCREAEDQWITVGEYCEVDSNGVNTGYYVVTQQNVGTGSPHFGQTRETKTYNRTACPEVSTDPRWVDDESFSGYCEEIYYEPSHTLANSGYWIGQEIDDNIHSATYGQTRQKRTQSSSCPAPSTNPDIEEVSSSCELTTTEDDFLVMTGYKISTGLDKNVYSPTYLQVTSARVQDVATCPPNEPKPEPTGCTAFIVDSGEINADATGDTGCDSAFLWKEGTPVFTPASASSWVTINYYHWGIDPDSTMCSNYANNPCVANSLMRQAGLVDDDLHCSDVPPHPLSDFPQIVQDAVNKTGKYANALGTVEYVIAANTSENSRSCTIHFIVDSVECPSKLFEITQEGSQPQPTGTCDCSTFEVYGLGVTVSSAASSTEYTVARYTGATDCSEPFTFSLERGSNFMGDFRVSGGYVYAKCIQDNPAASVRQSVYTMQQGSCSGHIYVNQYEKYIPPSDDGFYWQRSGNPTAITASSDSSYVDLTRFYSVLNGSYTNAVISANVNWIVTNSPLYYNNNELRPNVNPTVYMDFNTGSSPRSGRLTLTQKGGSSTIICDITQEPKPITCTVSSLTLSDTEVCKGTNLSFTFTMEDSRCTTLPTFMVRDGNNTWTTITASTISSGTGTGVIRTSSMASGNCRIYPVDSPTFDIGQNFTITNCGLSLTMNLTNSVGSSVSIDYIDLYSYSDSETVSLGSSITIPNGSSTAITKTIAAEFSGKTITQVILRNSSESKAYRGVWNSGVVISGMTANITISEALRSYIVPNNEIQGD